MRIALCLFFTVEIAISHAQGLRLWKEMKAKYPDEMAVYLKHNKQISIYIEDDSIKVTSHRNYDLLHLNEQSNVLAQEKVFTSHFVKLIDLQAKTLVPNNNRYKTLTVNNFMEMDERTFGVFFDDSRSQSFVFPGIEPGARSIHEYSVEIIDPRFLTTFYFGSFVPIEESKLTILVDKRISLKYELLHGDGQPIQFSKKEKGGTIEYEWKATDLESFTLESNAPKLSYFSPHLMFHIETATINGVEQNVLAGLDDLYRMYSGFINNLNEKENPELKQIVDSLVHGITSEEEKVKKIYYWVQDNIKYIAFENGMRGFIPHDADWVCEKRYGDCKDMASITQNMLELAGIKSYLTWIGSRDIPYKYTDSPTPLVDNHMITTYENNGQYYFLDATSKYTRFGLPSSMIQGKQALMAIGDKEFKIETVPVISKNQNLKLDTSYIKLDGDKIIGEGKMSLDGYVKVFNSYKLIGLDKKGEKRFIRYLLNKGNNKFFIDHYSIKKLQSKDHPLVIEYEFILQDYFNSVDDEIYLNMSLEKPFFNRLIDTENRNAPIENEYLYTHSQTVVLEIPENYVVEYLPPQANFKNELIGFDIDYKVDGNRVYQQKNFYINYLILEKQDFEDWNQAIKVLNKAYREVLVLKRP